MPVITRRSVLGGTVGIATLSAIGAAADGVTVPVWPGEPPGGGGPDGPLNVSAGGALSNIARPTLTLVRPDRPSSTAVLVAGGGGYTRIQFATEAMPAARWLARRGIAAYVLAYRLPSENWAAGPLAPLQDAQRALRLIRAGVAGRAAPHRIGVLGFSAGGHLMGMAAARSDFASYAAVDAADRLTPRPDAAALIYPVITLRPPYADTQTRRALIGRHPAPGAAVEWSVDTWISAGDPPMFLVQADDDPISDPVNARMAAAACQAVGVPVEDHRLPSGGHGFGMGDPGRPSAAWPQWFEPWLQSQGFGA